MRKDIEKNRIPRNFNRIVGEMLIDTNMDKAGDKVHVFKNDSGYLVLNLRTGKYAHTFASILRDSCLFKILEIA